MMQEVTIKVYDCIGAEGRSRANVAKLKLNEVPADATVVLDFEGVRF